MTATSGCATRAAAYRTPAVVNPNVGDAHPLAARHLRFQTWERTGVFEALWKAGLSLLGQTTDNFQLCVLIVNLTWRARWTSQSGACDSTAMLAS